MSKHICKECMFVKLNNNYKMSYLRIEIGELN